MTASIRFEDRGEVGRGGTSVIRLVHDRVLDRDVAMKVAAPGMQPGFVAEACVMGQLEHPNIVPVYDVVAADEAMPDRLLMKLVHGRTLAQILQELTVPSTDGPVLERLLATFIKVCDAVEYAHSRDIVHRDINVRNVMVGSYGEVYLMDWGLAVHRSPSGVVTKITGEIALGASCEDEFGSGTMVYMAPEQAWGRIEAVDARTDVFGLGGLLYEVMTLRPPYVADDVFHLLQDARNGRVPHPTSVAQGRALPARLCDITMRALAANPADRYQTVRALREDVEAFVREGGWFPAQSFRHGATLMREGEVSDVAYLVTAGECEVFKMVEGERRALRRVGPGELVGEIALVTRAPRSATVEAMTDVTALVVTRAALDQELARASWVRVLIDTAVRRFAALDG